MRPRRWPRCRRRRGAIIPSPPRNACCNGATMCCARCGRTVISTRRPTRRKRKCRCCRCRTAISPPSRTACRRATISPMRSGASCRGPSAKRNSLAAVCRSAPPSTRTCSLSRPPPCARRWRNTTAILASGAAPARRLTPKCWAMRPPGAPPWPRRTCRATSRAGKPPWCWRSRARARGSASKVWPRKRVATGSRTRT